MEKWKDIQGYENLYQVSNLGRVKSLHWGRSKILSPRNYGRGYQHVWLSKNSKRTSPAIHRLVANAFIDNPKNLPFVNHIDNTPPNNRSDNLEWCTAKGNMEHANKQHRLCAGENHYKAKLNWEKVREIRSKYDGSNAAQLAREYKVTHGSIWFIVRNMTWITTE